MRLGVWVLPLFALLAGAAVGQQRGDVPPALVWDKVKGKCPPRLDWSNLLGNVVVVSLGSDDVFPEDVAEWTDVQRTFQGKPVVFLLVVAGSEFLLEQALSQTANTKAADAGCVLLDGQQSNRRNLKLPFFPSTVVIDQVGVIAGYSSGGPDERAILALLNHERETGLSVAPPQPGPYHPTYEPTTAARALPAFEVHISAASKDELRALGRGGPDVYISRNQPLKNIVMDLWETPFARISFPEKFDELNYNVTARIPFADLDLLRRLVREAIEKRFGLTIEKEMRMQPIYSLVTAPSASARIQPAEEDDICMSGGGQASLIGTAQSMQDIARALEGLSGRPVIDETGLKGKYNYSVSSKIPRPEVVFDFADQLGLKLTPAERQIEILVVRQLKSSERK
jgi:uncharacterized protein (TIGR03435 family)